MRSPFLAREATQRSGRLAAQPATSKVADFEGRLPVGHGLLDERLSRGRKQNLLLVLAAYAAIQNDRQENLGLWVAGVPRVVDSIKSNYRELGCTAPPFTWDALWARIDLAAPGGDANAHVSLMRALMTDYSRRFSEQLLYRLQTGGNVHLQFSGPTGMGKSSCAIAVADWIDAIKAADLTKHLSFDLGELPGKLAGKRPGQTVVQDEYVRQAGEGARTALLFFENLEDTMRGSQVNLFVLSPKRQDHNTMQAELELIMWSPERKFSVFLVWLEGKPHGVVAIPWARPDLWEAYGPWKEANLKRSLAGQFNDNTYLVRLALKAFDDQRLVEFLTTAPNKPKKGDFESALTFFQPQMLAASQTERLAGFMHGLSYSYDRLVHKFEPWFGLQPNEGLRLVAEKCFEE